MQLPFHSICEAAVSKTAAAAAAEKLFELFLVETPKSRGGINRCLHGPLKEYERSDSHFII